MGVSAGLLGVVIGLSSMCGAWAVEDRFELPRRLVCPRVDWMTVSYRHQELRLELTRYQVTGEELRSSVARALFIETGNGGEYEPGTGSYFGSVSEPRVSFSSNHCDGSGSYEFGLLDLARKVGSHGTEVEGTVSAEIRGEGISGLPITCKAEY